MVPVAVNDQVQHIAVMIIDVHLVSLSSLLRLCQYCSVYEQSDT